jgi:hypothetical protein
MSVHPSLDSVSFDQRGLRRAIERRSRSPGLISSRSRVAHRTWQMTSLLPWTMHVQWIHSSKGCEHPQQNGTRGRVTCPTGRYLFSQSTSAHGKTAFLTALKKIGRDCRGDAVARRALAAVETSRSRHDGNDRGRTEPVGFETRTARVQRSRRRGKQQLARGEQPLRR